MLFLIFYIVVTSIDRIKIKSEMLFLKKEKIIFCCFDFNRCVVKMQCFLNIQEENHESTTSINEHVHGILFIIKFSLSSAKI